jgi:CO/xanthine dehydrogenase Mo-binding subunit
MSQRHFIPESTRQEEPTGDYKYIGKSIKRVEDPRLLTGYGNYMDDIDVPNMAHAACVRSPYAHARIVSVDKTQAEALPGVILVMSGADFAEVTDYQPGFSSPHVPQRSVAVDKVRHVGEPVAVVVAESRYIAEDACDLIEVEYEELPAVVDPEEAITMTGDAVLHPELGDSNVVIDQDIDFGTVEKDFAEADRVIKRRLRWPRSAGQPLEPSCALAIYNKGKGKFDIHANTQMYNFVVKGPLAQTLRVPETNLNIIPPNDTGGSFGAKVFIFRVMTIAAAAARECGRPVKYMEDRVDATTACDSHGSDRIYDAELALTKDGTMTSFRFRCVDDYGAYFQLGIGQHSASMAQVTGPYRINSVGMKLIVVLTNKCQIGPYRGFGAEVSNWVIERMVDAAVDELGADPIEFRLQNMIQPEQFPYIIPTGNCYDSGNYQEVMKVALELANYNEWRKKQAEARKEGRYIGIGVTSCQERSTYNTPEWWMFNHQPGFNLTCSPESVSLSMNANAEVTVTLHSPFIGNSPETVVTQVVAEQLQIDPSAIKVNYACSDQGLPSVGPSGSRVTVMTTGAAVGAATQIRNKLLKVAGHLMDIDPPKLELRDGNIGVIGDPNKEMTLAEVAVVACYFRRSLPDDPEFNSGLNAIYTYDHPFNTPPSEHPFLPKDQQPEEGPDTGIFYPFMGHMVHIPVIEIDVETGQIEFLDYACVHDCGTVVNPQSLDGQIRGGTVQGIGSTLSEHFYYDENGQMTNTTFVDYLIPGLAEVPTEMRVGHVETPSPYTEYGVKGAGEGGRMGAPSAISQAVEDALKPLGVKVDELPLTQKRLRALIREAEGKLAS